MRIAAVAFSVTLLVAGAAARDYPHAFPRDGVRRLLDNPRFTIWEVHWKLNTPQPVHRHRYDMAGVYLRFGTIAVTTPDGKVTVGDPWPVPRPYFQRKDITHKEEAVGKPGDPERMAIMIDLKDVAVTPFTAPPGMAKAFPRDDARNVLENERVRMWDYTWQPGKPVARHVHDTDSIVVFVTGGKLKTVVDGRDEIADVAPETAVYAPRGRVDSEEAIGAPIRAVIVELKNPGSGGHPAEFWKAIAKNGFAPPAGSDVGALALELCDLFASPDPELRDDVAYSTLVAWVYQKKLLNAAMVTAVAAVLRGNLRADIGSIGTDAVFRRSFSALALSAVVARDNADPVLDEAAFRALLESALQYLADEKDVRGFDAGTGWMHSAAHTADLLKFLARSRYATAADQTAILDGILRKMTTSPVFVFGEDERHARAILSIVNRKDFNREAYTAWVTRAKPGPLPAGLPSVNDLQSRQNVKNLLAKLEVLLSADPAASDNIVFARDQVRAVLKDLF